MEHGLGAALSAGCEDVFKKLEEVLCVHPSWSARSAVWTINVSNFRFMRQKNSMIPHTLPSWKVNKTLLEEAGYCMGFANWSLARNTGSAPIFICVLMV